MSPRERELHDRVPLPGDEGYQDLRQLWFADNELGGRNETYYVTFEDGTHGIYKPVSGEMMHWRSSIQQGTYADREVAAFRLAEDVGIDHLIPPTTLHDGPEGPGSLQEWVEGSGPAQPVSSYPRSDRDHMALLDYLMGTTDRGWRTSPDGRVVAIDQGLTFPEDASAPIRSPFLADALERQEPFSQEVLDQWRAVDPDQIRRTLEDAHIPDAAIDGVMARLEEIQSEEVQRTGMLTGEAWSGEIWSR